jgi:hypothetical protein
LNVGFDSAEYFFVSLNGYMQRVKQSLGRVKVQDNALLDFDRFVIGTHRLGIHSKVNDQFLRRTGDAAKIGVTADCLGFVNRDGIGSRFFFVFSHDFLDGSGRIFSEVNDELNMSKFHPFVKVNLFSLAIREPTESRLLPDQSGFADPVPIFR